jgi:hypothetical protein
LFPALELMRESEAANEQPTLGGEKIPGKITAA